MLLFHNDYRYSDIIDKYNEEYLSEFERIASQQEYNVKSHY